MVVADEGSSDMADAENMRDDLVSSLRERAKELNCLYDVEKLLNAPDREPAEVYQSVAEVIAPGLQFPDICEVCLEMEGERYVSSDFAETDWCIGREIEVQGERVGRISVYYTAPRSIVDDGPFLKEEVQLLGSLADRLGQYALFLRLQDMRETWRVVRDESPSKTPEWRIVLDMILQSDKTLYLRLSRKMLNQLCSMGVEEAQALLQGSEYGTAEPEEFDFGDTNVPGLSPALDESILLEGRPFALAETRLGKQEILKRIQWWLQEDKIGFLVKVLGNPRSTLQEIADALRRYYHVVARDFELPQSTLESIRVSLSERILTEQLGLTRVAKDYAHIAGFRELVDRIIMPDQSLGKIGGKGAGLLLASWIHRDACEQDSTLRPFRIPKTWYVASDGIMDFIVLNDLEDVFEQKYKDTDVIRREYPNIVQLFKNSPFPPEMLNGLAAALDDFGESPLIVRSSSLLEDRFGTAFSGKYKSLFLANQGTKSERLAALVDAIAEIYASVFAPDPIEYRREMGLLEFHEQMGLLIQEVVGRRVGRYWLPAFGGVAFSLNEFRWSPRISREDGLIRLVPGMGTRAVDRTSNDYPVLVVPNKPELQVNVAFDEIVRYAPKHVDLINLETNAFETVEIAELIRECGHDYPGLNHVFSVVGEDRFQRPSPVFFDPERDEVVASFQGLREDTSVLRDLSRTLEILAESLQTPVDIEFAHDGTDFYLLQCRPQSASDDEAPAPIPKDIPRQDILFTAHSHVSNGWMPEITHIVYVDPEGYSRLGSRSELLSVARVVGKLNKILPKKQFILMGPGRWGSRGDIKLGVSVSYADISNTAMLVEIARRTGGYLPDLSFGTHFFQDLVESRIRYLPLYPDDDDSGFNEAFFRSADNLLSSLLPDHAHLADTVRVIDVPANTGNRVANVLMNADLDEAVAMLAEPGRFTERPTHVAVDAGRAGIEFWRWRQEMAERLALSVDAEGLGVVAMYLFGSVKNATAGPGSDIDLLVHVRSTPEQLERLALWLDGWSRSLAEINYQRTGYRTDGLLDVHFVTDEDIAERSSYAVKIDAVTDAARPLPLGE